MKNCSLRKQRLAQLALLAIIITGCLSRQDTELSDIHSSFENIFNDFSKTFDSAPISYQNLQQRELQEPKERISEVKFTDQNGDMKSKAEIKREIETNFGINKVDPNELGRVMQNFENNQRKKKQTENRKLKRERQNSESLELQNKIKKIMNLGLAGEILSERPDIKEDGRIKKGKNWVEYDENDNVQDHFEKPIKSHSKNQVGKLRESSWGNYSKKRRVLKNGGREVSNSKKSRKTIQGPNGNQTFQESSFSSSSFSNGGNFNPLMASQVMNSQQRAHRPMFGDMFLPEQEINRMNQLHQQMLNNMDEMFVPSEDFANVKIPSRLLSDKHHKKHKKHKKNKKHRKHKKNKKHRKLNNFGYTEYPQYNMVHEINPMNVVEQNLDQYQENNTIGIQNNFDQSNDVNFNGDFIAPETHHHHHHHHGHNHNHSHFENGAFNPSLIGNTSEADYTKMEGLYSDYLAALEHVNEEDPRASSHQISMIEHQMELQHKKNPYFGNSALFIPQMIPNETEVSMHLPEQFLYSPVPETTIHHHIYDPPVVPMQTGPLSPVSLHNFQLFYGDSAPSHLNRNRKKRRQKKQRRKKKETKLQMQHMKEDLEVKFKHEMQVEIGDVRKHEEELQAHTDEEIKELVDLTKRVSDSKTQAPTLNVEHTVMSLNGQQVHQTAGGEVVIDHNNSKHSDDHSNSSYSNSSYSDDSEGESMKTTVIQKITPILIDGNGKMNIGTGNLDPSGSFHPGHRKRGSSPSLDIDSILTEDLDEEDISLPLDDSKPSSHTSSDTNADTSSDTNADTSSDTNADTSSDTNADTSSDTSVGTSHNTDSSVEQILIQREPGTSNTNTVEVHDIHNGQDSVINDTDEDMVHSHDGVNQITNIDNQVNHNSVNNQLNEHVKNEIFNQKNTHIIHHMGEPSDSRVVNINLNLLNDGQGGFYFKGDKPNNNHNSNNIISNTQTIEENNYNDLDDQLDNIRTEQLNEVNKHGQINDDEDINNIIVDDQNPSNENEDVVTKIDHLEDVHEVDDQDLRADLIEAILD